MGSGEDVSANDLRNEVDKEVFVVIDELYTKGAVTLQRAGHKAKMLCTDEDCIGWISVPGTAKNPGNAAKRLRRWAKRCPEHPK